MRPGDNKWTMTIWGRDANTGLAKFGYQKTPHDEWDYAGVNVMMLSDQEVNGKATPLLTHPDRNGIIYTLNRQTGGLLSANKSDDTVNWAKKVDLKTGLPIRDPEYSTRMDHRAKNICPSAMGYHNQGLDSYDPEKEPFFIRSVDPTRLIEPLRKQKHKPVWLGFPNSGRISGEFGRTPTQ